MLDLKLDLLRYYILLTDRFTKQKIGSLDDLEGLFSNKSSKIFKFFPYFPDVLYGVWPYNYGTNTVTGSPKTVTINIFHQEKPVWLI